MHKLAFAHGDIKISNMNFNDKTRTLQIFVSSHASSKAVFLLLNSFRLVCKILKHWLRSFLTSKDLQFSAQEMWPWTSSRQSQAFMQHVSYPISILCCCNVCDNLKAWNASFPPSSFPLPVNSMHCLQHPDIFSPNI